MKIHKKLFEELLKSKGITKDIQPCNAKKRHENRMLKEAFAVQSPETEVEDEPVDTITRYGNYLYDKLKKKYAYFSNESANMKLYGPYFRGIEVKLFQRKDNSGNLVNCALLNVSFLKKTDSGTNQGFSMNFIPGGKYDISEGTEGVQIDDDTEYKIYAILNVLLGNKFRFYSKVVSSDQFGEFLTDRMQDTIADSNQEIDFIRALLSVIVPSQYVSERDLKAQKEFSQDEYREALRFIESSSSADLTFRESL